jgi:hypothetical protein
MPRKKPFSSKQRKAQLQEKRAIKRGDISPPPISRNPKRHKRPVTARSVASTPAIESSKRLQSAFVKLSSDYLAKSKLVASSVALPRPLSPNVAIFSLLRPLISDAAVLSCPKRPKWRYEMTKKEVEKNEEGLFDKWLTQTDHILQTWTNENTHETSQLKGDSDADLTMPRAPTNYERNLEVWRQLYVDILSSMQSQPESAVDGESQKYPRSSLFCSILGVHYYTTHRLWRHISLISGIAK